MLGISTGALFLYRIIHAWFKGVQRDRIRFQLFAVKDRLYLAAANGLVPVESKAFQMARYIINCLIVENKIQAALEIFARHFDGASKDAESIFEGLSFEGRKEATQIFGVVFDGYDD